MAPFGAWEHYLPAPHCAAEGELSSMGLKSGVLRRMPAPLSSPPEPSARPQARALPVSADWLATLSALARAARAWSGLLPPLGW